MKDLKKYIIKLFLLIIIPFSLILSIIDSIFDGIAETINDESIMVTALIIYGVVSVGVLVFAVWVFTHFISKRIVLEKIRDYKEKSMLFANIAHDLKTPMTTVIGFSKALSDGEVTDETEQKEMLHSIYQKSMRANELLDLIFQYTKFDALDFKLNIHECDITKLLRNLVAEYYNDFEKKNITLEIDIPDTKVLVNIDIVEFSRGLSNLIINAYRHNPDNAKVMIQLENRDGIKITIADNGQTIEDDTVFEAFVCGDESRSTKGGSGLGLAISKKIVEQHGGQLYIDSQITGYAKGFIIIL